MHLPESDFESVDNVVTKLSTIKVFCCLLSFPFRYVLKIYRRFIAGLCPTDACPRNGIDWYFCKLRHLTPFYRYSFIFKYGFKCFIDIFLAFEDSVIFKFADCSISLRKFLFFRWDFFCISHFNATFSK